MKGSRRRLYVEVLALVFIRSRGCLSSGKKRFDSLSQSRNRRRHQERAQLQRNSEGFSHTRRRLSGEQGMASEAEKVLVDTDLLSAQNLREDSAQPLLDLALWHIRGFFRLFRELDRRQGLVI